MRKILLLLGLVLIAVPSYATPAFVGAAKSTTSTSASPCTVTYAPTNGNFVVLAVYANANITTTAASVGATITINASTAVLNDGAVYGQSWYGEVTSGSVTSFTFIPSGSVSYACFVAEYSGIATTSPADGVATRVTTTGAISLTPTNGDLVVYINPQNGFAFTTSYGNARATATTANSLYLNDVLGSSGTQAPNGGAGDTSYICILAAFLPSAGGGGSGGGGFGGKAGIGGKAGFGFLHKVKQ
jgi:hypothetical protein